MTDGSSKKDVLFYYLFSFFIGLYLANGTTVLFEQALGFSFFQIFVAGGLYMLMFILFEIPSGAFADLIGRRRSMMAGGLILALGALATGLSNTFPQVLASFLLWALGFSFISGADEALLYDKLGNSSLYAKIVGRAHFFALLGTALAGIAGPYLFSLNFRFAYLSSAGPFLLAALAIGGFGENHEKTSFSLERHFRQITAGVKAAYQNKFVLWAIGIMSLVFAVWYTFTNSYQPYLRNIGFPLSAFSIILPVMFLAEALGGRLGGRLYNYFKENQLFFWGLLALAVVFGSLGLWPVKPVLAALLAYQLLQGIFRPLISTYTNRHIESSTRATVISVQAMIATITAALMLFLFGFLTDKIGLNNLLIVLGGLVLVLGGLLFWVKPREETM